MTASKHREWFVPTLTLSIVWAIATALMIVLAMSVRVALPAFVAKAGPFILAGFITGRLLSVAERWPKVIASGVLAIVAALGWTVFSLATREIGNDKALELFLASLPVMLFTSCWAYLGMYLGGLQGMQGARELEEAEKELRQEMASEQ
jgi:hypothetical protein